MNSIFPQHGIENGSFRDPSGFVFYRETDLYRQINQSASEDYEHLMRCGLYSDLVQKKYLVEHVEVDISPEIPEKSYKIIKPTRIPFITYPYEWSFSQLKEAALLTLEIEERALSKGMTLKDASCYNIQFNKGSPVFIDTLSFERYVEGSPWVAYKQFCEHFLGPLYLMSYADFRFIRNFQLFPSGIPLDLISKMLPLKSWLNIRLALHIHLHARSKQKFEQTSEKIKVGKIPKNSLIGIIQSLKKAVINCNCKLNETEWAQYYNKDNNYSERGFDNKKNLVQEYISIAKPRLIWDVGANQGDFSKICADNGADVLALDLDPGCVDYLYNTYCKKGINIYPVLQDLTSPSPSIGWDCTERVSLKERSHPDTILALALIHHLFFTGQIPIPKIADFFSSHCHFLIIEFIPVSDSQVKRMICNRTGDFSEYSQENFETEFSFKFRILRKDLIIDSNRTIYLMERNNEKN